MPEKTDAEELSYKVKIAYPAALPMARWNKYWEARQKFSGKPGANTTQILYAGAVEIIDEARVERSDGQSWVVKNGDDPETIPFEVAALVGMMVDQWLSAKQDFLSKTSGNLHDMSKE